MSKPSGRLAACGR